MLSLFDETFVVLDALDQATDQEEIISLVLTLERTKSRCPHIFVASRNDGVFKHAFDGIAMEIVITEDTVQEDICKHVQKRLAQDRHLQRWPASLPTEIETRLVEGAKVMFRWADCQLDRITKCIKLSAVHKVLETLPKTPHETYQLILAQIDEDVLPNTLVVFEWLLCANYTLSASQIVEVLAIECGSESKFRPENRLLDAKDLLAICSSLISVDFSSTLEDPTVRLAHASVKDFIEHIGEDEKCAIDWTFDTHVAHGNIAEACITYLTYVCSSDNVGSLLHHSFPLKNYAARYWMTHLREAGEPAALCERALVLLNGDATRFERLQTLFDIDRPWKAMQLNSHGEVISRPRREQSDRRPPTPVYYAAMYGLDRLVKKLLFLGADPGGALTAAASRGHLTVVQTLMQVRADSDNYRGFPDMSSASLMSATMAGHAQVVQFLLEQGVHADRGHYRSGTPLLQATRNGHREVVRALIEHGVDVNSREGKTESTISIVAVCGHNEIVTMLLDAGAYFNKWDLRAAASAGHARTVEILMTALEKDHQLGREQQLYQPVKLGDAGEGGLDNIVRQILDQDKDADRTRADLGAALKGAAEKGHLGTTGLLLSRDPELEHKVAALDRAADSGHIDVFRLIMEHSPPAVVNERYDRRGPGTHSNLLQSAAQGGNLAIVQEILRYNPDVNFVSDDGWGNHRTALACAASIGHLDMVRLLLDHGALANNYAQTEYYNVLTPLGHAAYGGLVAVARALLQAGADISMPSGGDKYSPLAWVIKSPSNRVEMVNLLVDGGADVSNDTSVMRAAFGHDTFNDEPEVLELLVNCGADINARIYGKYGFRSADPLGEGYAYPLQVATMRNRPESLRYLLTRGADINAQDGVGFTALHEAANCGHLDIMKTLVVDFNANVSPKLLNGSTPMHLAAQSGHKECVKFLLTHDVDVNVRIHEQRTPLHAAVDNLRLDTVRTLVKCGASMDSEDQDGMTALDLAQYSVTEQYKRGIRRGTERYEEVTKILVEEWNKTSPDQMIHVEYKKNE